MDIPIEIPEFSGRGLTVRPAGWFSSASVVVEGEPVDGRRGRFILSDNDGRQVTFRLRSNYIDPIPKVTVDDRPIVIARPLRWYEYVWSGLPILLALTGGALGAICGLVALKENARIFRSDGSTVRKLLTTALVSVTAAIAWYMIVKIVFTYALSPVR